MLVVITKGWLFDPLTPVSDQNKISPYYICTKSSRQVMRIKKNINWGVTNWFDTKFFKLTMRIVWQTVRRITNEILGVKGLSRTTIKSMVWLGGYQLCSKFLAIDFLGALWGTKFMIWVICLQGQIAFKATSMQEYVQVFHKKASSTRHLKALFFPSFWSYWNCKLYNKKNFGLCWKTFSNCLVVLSCCCSLLHHKS